MLRGYIARIAGRRPLSALIHGEGVGEVVFFNVLQFGSGEMLCNSSVGNAARTYILSIVIFKDFSG